MSSVATGVSRGGATPASSRSDPTSPGGPRLVRASWLRLGLAALAGLGVVAGFAPYGQWVPLLAGLALLAICLEGLTVRSGAVVGVVFGAAFMLALLPWLRAIGTDTWLGLSLLEAVFFAAYGAGHVLVRRWPAWPLWAACWWVAVEALRGQVPLGGFPWGRLAFSIPDGPFADWPRWVGVPATSGVVAVTGFALAAVVCSLLRRPPARSAWGAVLPALAVVGLVAGSPLLPAGIATKAGEVSVALVQGGVPGTGADGRAEQQAVVGNHVAATRAYAAAVAAGEAEPADIVIWPENGSDLDPFAHEDVGAAVQGAVDAVGVPVLVGAIVQGPSPDTALNAGIVWTPGTGAGERYVKRHLVPFGEYIPFREVFAPLVSRLDQIPRDMVPGEEPGVLSLGPVLVGDLICFDVAYDDTVRDLGRSVDDGGAELLSVQTNNATYLGSSQPAQQWAISRVRAVETGRDLVVASINGISGVASAEGDTVLQSRSGGQQVLTAPVRLAAGSTWGVRLGAWWELVLSLAGVAAVGAGVVTERVSRRRRGRTGVSADPPDSEPVAVAR